MDKQVLNYEIDYMELLYENNNISIYNLDAIHLGLNKSNMYISEECVKRSLASFADMPVYGIIDNQYNVLDGVNNDFLEHFREEYPWLATRDRILPFGTVPESSVNKAKLVERDGRVYLRMQVVVWKRLLPHVSEILQRRDGTVKVSVEFTIEEGHQCPETGTIYVDKFCITAITVLGAKFEEVMEGSMLKSVKFAYNNYLKTCNDNYYRFSTQKEYEIPANVLKSMKDGVEKRYKYGRGGTQQIYNSMKISTENGKLFDSQIVEMKRFFDSYKPTSPDKPTNKNIVFSMYGGEEGMNWVNSVYNGDADVINSKESQDKIGGGSKIEIDNSKESAIDSQSWENPGKALYGKIMEASNYKALLNEAYLIVDDGYEDAPSENLKYPHHLVKGNKLVLDVKGVQSALARAKQTGAFNEEKVKKHLKRHYNELGLSTDAFEKEDSGRMEEVKNTVEEIEDKDQKCAEMEAKCATLEEKCADMDQKCAEMTQKCAEMEAKLAEYKKKENEAVNNAFAQKFAHCFDEETKCALAEKVAEMSCDDFKNAVCEKVMSFAESMADVEKCSTYCEALKAEKCAVEDTHVKFSVNPFINPETRVQKDQLSSIEKVIGKSKTKVI